MISAPAPHQAASQPQRARARHGQGGHRAAASPGALHFLFLRLQSARQQTRTTRRASRMHPWPRPAGAAGARRGRRRPRARRPRPRARRPAPPGARAARPAARPPRSRQTAFLPARRPEAAAEDMCVAGRRCMCQAWLQPCGTGGRRGTPLSRLRRPEPCGPAAPWATWRRSETALLVIKAVCRAAREGADMRSASQYMIQCNAATPK
jgi:hypothetical protein